MITQADPKDEQANLAQTFNTKNLAGKWKIKHYTQNFPFAVIEQSFSPENSMISISLFTCCYLNARHTEKLSVHYINHIPELYY